MLGEISVAYQNPYGRTLDDGTEQVYCDACSGWCNAQSCSCKDCQAALFEYRESLRTEDVI